MLIYFLDDDSHSQKDSLETVLMRENKVVYNEVSKPLEKEIKEDIRLWKEVPDLIE